LPCLHTENTGQKRLVRPVEEPSNNADNEDNFERSKNITELVSSDSVVAVKAEVSVNKRSRARSRVTRCKVKTGIVNKNANSRNMNYSLIEVHIELI
jgi:hypothetical protein